MEIHMVENRQKWISKVYWNDKKDVNTRCRGVLGSLSNAHKQTHHLGHQTSFLRVENMWIIGAEKWTECVQKRRYAARINNGNL